jgi:hypothetical protein
VELAGTIVETRVKDRGHNRSGPEISFSQKPAADGPIPESFSGYA